MASQVGADCYVRARMSLLPEAASLEEMIQECFLAYRGAGLSLSALDAELLSSWARSGAPFEAIALGIRRAAEKAAWHARPGELALPSLRACRRQVEKEIRIALWRAAGSGEKPKRSPSGRAKIREALRRVAAERPELAAGISALDSALRSRTADSPRQIDLLVARLLRALPFAERLAVLQGVRIRTQPLAERASVRARVLARRFERSAALRNTLGLPAFW